MLRFYFCLDRNSITLVSGASTSTSIDIETDSSNADDSIPIPNASNSNMPSGVSRFAISESVSKEILWALKCVWSHRKNFFRQNKDGLLNIVGHLSIFSNKAAAISTGRTLSYVSTNR